MTLLKSALQLASLTALFLGGCASKQPESAGVQNPLTVTTPDAKRVLLVVNKASDQSREIGEYYMKRRGIPSSNVVYLDCSRSDNVSPDEYLFGIQNPIQEAIQNSSSPIDFVVLTKGIPIRIRDDEGFSVDGHLAAMNLKITPIDKIDEESIRQSINPYFGKNEKFSSKKFNMYLVTRLDGYDVAQCKKLVDNSIAAKSEVGLFFFDAATEKKTGGYLDMQQTLYRANQVLKAKGYESKLDETDEFVLPEERLSGYASWGSNDGHFSLETYRKLKFKPGALAETFVSTSGRSFNRTQGGQSMIADLIEDGVTGCKGYVSEPFTFALAKPDILFDRYTSGFNLAESFYMASVVVKWKDVVIGDPLCSPYAKRQAITLH